MVKQDKFKYNDQVCITNPAYGPVAGLTGKVSDTGEYTAGFRVDLGGFEVVIRNPVADLEFAGVDIAAIAHHAFPLKRALGGGHIGYYGSEPEVTLEQRVFVTTFDTYGYEISGTDTRKTVRLVAYYLDAQGRIKFEAHCGADEQLLAQAEAWIAAQTQAADSQIPVADTAPDPVEV